MSGILCALFAICASVAEPSGDRLPTWSETATYATPLVAQWEGSGPTLACDESPSGVCVRAYLDTIASPPVWTVCYGETFDVRPNEVRTIESCRAGLQRGLERYWRDYRAAVTIDRLRPEPDAAMTSLTWNIGVGAAARSTALRRLNAGDVAGACEAATWFNRAGGRVIRGLQNRRAAEYQLCMRGV